MRRVLLKDRRPGIPCRDIARGINHENRIVLDSIDEDAICLTGVQLIVECLHLRVLFGGVLGLQDYVK